VKIGAKVVRHGRYVTFQVAEVAIPRRLFANLAPDRRPAAEASTDMTSNVIAARLNRRAPGARHLPKGHLLTPTCTLARARIHRVAHPRSRNWDQ